MDLRRLRYFVAVAEAAHMTRAAEVLGMQQPPLSQQIKLLEAELGLQLLERHPKGVRLTASGRIFLDEARRILEDVDAMAHRMASIAQGVRGVLTVGFTSSAATHAFTPRTLRLCRTRHPELQLQLSEHNAAEMTERIDAARLHCGFLRVPVARPPGLHFETVLEEPIVLAVPVDHALATPGKRRTPVPLQALDDQPMILVRRPNAPGLYANFLARCAQAGVTPRVVAEVDRMMTNLNLVAAGVGLSIVPASMQGLHTQSICYRPLPRTLGLSAALTLAYRADACAGPLATFVALVREIAQNEATADTASGEGA